MINLYIDHIIFLKSKKDSIQNALLRPTVGAHINAMPATKFFRQTAPFTTVFGNVQDSVNYL